MSAVLERPAAIVREAAPAPLLRRLFEPIELNTLRLDNRVLMGSVHLNMEELPDQYERKAHFYAVRARGGAGLIVTAGCSPNAEGSTGPGGFVLDSDELVARHALITDAVHQAGGRIALQLLHFGREAFHGKLVAPSPLRLEANIFTPRALADEEIVQTAEDFAQAARRAVAAGYDAIELIFSQGFLVHQFLSPHTNQRTDRWGGSLENRMRLAILVARRVRETVGARFPLLFRIPCLDLVPGALQPEETAALVEALLPYGIDLLNVSIGWHESDVPTIAMTVPRAGFSPVAARIKARFPALKVCVSNRINEPRQAEQLLQDGVADMVSMARPFLADPELVNKARANRFEQINTCIACNQSCLDFVFTGHPVGCSVNPECGDAREGSLAPFAAPMRIAVVGGGLAGMAAALYAARRGAHTELFERSSTLGGQLHMARRIPKKDEFGETVRYYEEALVAHGVRIHRGVDVDRARLAGGGWDHVFIATGSQASRPHDLPGAQAPHVLTFDQVLRERIPVQFPAVVIGGGGVACDLAKYLAAQHQARGDAGAHLEQVATRLPQEPIDRAWRAGAPAATDTPPVTLVQRSAKKFAFKLGRTTRWILMNELDRQGVRMLKAQDILAIEADGVRVQDRRTRVPQLLPARTVILATGQAALSALADTCAELQLPCSLIGAASDQGGLVSVTTATGSAYRAVLALP